MNIDAAAMKDLMVSAGGLSADITEEAIMSSTFEELDFDSIARMALVTSIENNFGVRVDDATANKHDSPADLLADLQDIEAPA